MISMRPLSGSAVSIGWVFLLALCSSSSTYSNDALETKADEGAVATNRLEAIKEKLVEAAFGKGIRVRSVAYLDETGTLKQDTFFSSEVEIRGNQVLAYLNEFDKDLAIGEAELPAEKVCDAWEAQGKKERGVVKLRSSVRTARKVSENAIPEDKRRELIEMLDRALTSEGFNVVYGSDPGSSGRLQDTTYYENLVSNWAQGPTADFEVSLDLDLVNKSTHIFPSIYSSHTVLYGPEIFLSNVGSRDYALELTAKFSQPASGRVLDEQTLAAGFIAQRHYSSGAWTLGERDQAIDDWMQEAVQSFISNSQCLPQVFAVEPLSGSTFSISAGLAHGINIGSWIVVAHKDLMIGNMVSDVTFDSLSIMKVLSSSNYSAIAEPLATSENFSDSMRVALTGMLL